MPTQRWAQIKWIRLYFQKLNSANKAKIWLLHSLSLAFDSQVSNPIILLRAESTRNSLMTTESYCVRSRERTAWTLSFSRLAHTLWFDFIFIYTRTVNTSGALRDITSAQHSAFDVSNVNRLNGRICDSFAKSEKSMIHSHKNIRIQFFWLLWSCADSICIVRQVIENFKEITPATGPGFQWFNNYFRRKLNRQTIFFQMSIDSVVSCVSQLLGRNLKWLRTVRLLVPSSATNRIASV